MAKRWINSSLWEIRKQYHTLRFLALGYLILDLLLWVLPKTWCGVIAEKAFPLLILVSYLYVAGVTLIILYPSVSMTYQNSSAQEEMERMAGMGGTKKILTRIPANLFIVSVFYLNSLAGEFLMGKFADETHSYFSLDIYGFNVYQVILVMGVLFPIYYYGFFLLYQRRQGRRHPFLAYLTGAAAINMLMSGGGLLGAALFAVFLAAFCLWRGRGR